MIILGFLTLSFYGWARLVYSIQDWYWLIFANLRPGPAYLAVTGALWGLSGLVAMVWIFALRNGYQIIGAVVALLMALLYWADRILYQRNGEIGENTLFAVLMTFFLLAFTALVLRPFAGYKGAARLNHKRGSDVEIRARD